MIDFGSRPEAIPPAYSEFIGRQVMARIRPELAIAQAG